MLCGKISCLMVVGINIRDPTSTKGMVKIIYICMYVCINGGQSLPHKLGFS